LPKINLTEFFDLTEHKGVIIEISPNFSFEKNQEIIDKNIESYKDIQELIQKFPK